MGGTVSLQHMLDINNPRCQTSIRLPNMAVFVHLTRLGHPAGFLLRKVDEHLEYLHVVVGGLSMNERAQHWRVAGCVSWSLEAIARSEAVESCVLHRALRQHARCDDTPSMRVDFKPRIGANDNVVDRSAPAQHPQHRIAPESDEPRAGGKRRLVQLKELVLGAPSRATPTLDI